MVEEVSAKALNDRIAADEDVQVVDIRSPEEYARGHITGAMNLPMNRFAAEIESHEWGENVVVVCPLGKSSIQAARLLESYEGVPENASVASLEEGYRGWEYDLETEADSETAENADRGTNAPF